MSLHRGTEKWEGARSIGQASKLAERIAHGFLSSSPGAHLGLASQFRGPEGAVSGRESTLKPSSIANHPAVSPNSALKQRRLPRSHTVWSPQLLLCPDPGSMEPELCLFQLGRVRWLLGQGHRTHLLLRILLDPRGSCFPIPLNPSRWEVDKEMVPRTLGPSPALVLPRRGI